MARDLSYFDSPELAMVAVEAGLSHPPGQVLHTLLGALFTRTLPLPPLWILNGLSALFGALSLLPVISLTGSALDTNRAHGLPKWSPMLATLALLHAALWEQATRIEVYSLATFCGLWTLAVAADAFKQPRSAPGEDGANALRIGLGLGLTASANPVFALLTASGLLPALLRWSVLKKAFMKLALGGSAGLLPYAYIWVASQREDAFVWGAPSSWANALHYASGADFQQNLEVSVGTWAAHVSDLLTRPAARLTTPLLVFGISAGAWLGIGRLGRGSTLTVTALSIAYVARNAVWNPDIPDFVSYLALALHLCIAASVAAAVALVERGLRTAALALSGALCLLALFAEPSPFVRGRGEDRSARLIGSNALSSLPAHTIVIVGSDHVAWPMLYLQRVEQLRKDVVIFPRGLASSSWFWELTYRDHPELRPFALRGPGGPAGRLQRFLAAQPARPIAAESLDTLVELGLPACRGPWLVHSRHACDAAPPDTAQTVRGLAQARDSAHARGSDHTKDPSTEGAIAAVSFTLGVTAWRLGNAQAALMLLTAALSPEERALAWRVPANMLAQVTLLRAPAIDWQRPTPLGDPARNAFMAAQLVLAAGLPELAKRWLQLAADLDLPEAIAVRAAGLGE